MTTVTVTIELTDSQAMALAQFVKRLNLVRNAGLCGRL